MITTFQNIERHPLQPLLPKNAQVLMLGSFPPPKENILKRLYLTD